MRLSDHERATSTVTIDKAQFDKLIELLTPGYELALMYKAQAEKAPDVHPDADKMPMDDAS